MPDLPFGPARPVDFSRRQAAPATGNVGNPFGLPTLIDLPSMLPGWVTKDLGKPIRRALDPIIPDLDLRTQDLTEKLRGLQGPNGLPFGPVVRPESTAASVIASRAMGGDRSYPAGFIASAASSLPEFFGMPAGVESEVFRLQNPWMGLASQLIGPGGAYGAAFKISKTGRFASALEKGTETGLRFFGKTTAANPIAAGATRELLRYTPLELTRLGTGLTMWPENNDNLLWDVGLGSAFNAAFGAAGGLLRTAGQSAGFKRVKGLIDKNIGLLPTFELRLMKDPAARFEEGADAGGLIKQWTSRVLTAQPGVRGKGQDPTAAAERAFWELGDVGEEGQGLLNRLFKPNKSRATAEEISNSGLDVRLALPGKPTETSRAPRAMIGQLLRTFGLKDTSDLAANFVFPRLVKVTSPRMAGRWAKELDPAQNPGLRWFGDEQTLLAKDGAGLWVFAKRIGRTQGEAGARAPRQHGMMKAANGDYWFVGKTDRLDLLLPNTHGKEAQTIKDWAMMQARFRPGQSNDPFSHWMDMALDSMNLRDWEALRSGTRASGVARLTNRIKSKLAKEAGLVDQTAIRNAAEGLYDVFVPTARKEVSSPVYQRLWGMMKGVTQRADELVGQVMRGTSKFKGSPVAAIRNSRNVEHVPRWNDLETVDSLIHSLDEEELSLVANATQVPGSEVAETLERLAEDGLVSDRAREVIRQLQEINRRFLDEVVKPGLKAGGFDDAEVKWIEGYIMPRVYRGDYFIDIKNGKKTVYRVSGKNGSEAQAIAESIVEEARTRGQKWSAGDVRVFNELKADANYSLDQIMDAAAPVGSGDKLVQETVLAGLRRAMGGQKGIPKVKSVGSLKARSDLNVAPYQWKHDEVIKAIGNHYKQLARFAAMKTWHNRWYPEMAAWGEAGNKAMKEDLERKSAQLMGIELGLSRSQNEHMRQLFRLGESKPLTKLASTANSVMYNMMLGFFNLNFALLNVLTPLMTAVPWVAFMQRAPAYKQLQYMQVLPKLDAAGKPIGMASTLSPLKTFAQGMKILAKPSAEDKAMMERAIGDGTWDAQLYENFVGGPTSHLGQGLKESWNKGGGWQFLIDLANAPGTKSEQFSRAMTFSVGLALGKDFFGLADEALYRFAKKATEQMSYGYSLTDRARIMTGPVGSMLGLFKNWQFHYINQMAEYAGIAARDGVLSPAIWMMAMTGAVGGLGSLPIKGAIDGLTNIATDGDSKTAFEWLMKNYGEDHPMMADSLYFGLPGMLGASLQSSATMPGTDMVQDTANLANVVTWERAKQLAAVVAKMKEYSGVTGENPLTNDNLRAEFIGATMPRAISRLYSATEEDAILSMRSGYPSVQGVSPTAKLLHALGINQTEIERYQVAGKELFKQDERNRALISNLGMEYADAIRANDYALMEKVTMKAIMLGLPLDSIYKSAATRGERFSGDALDRYDQSAVEQYFMNRPQG